MPVVEAQTRSFPAPNDSGVTLTDAANGSFWLRPMEHLAGLAGATGAEIPETQTPEGDMPGSHIPESNNPQSQAPESKIPETDSPRTEEKPSEAPPVEVVVVSPKPDWAILLMDRMASAFRMVREGVLLAAVLFPWIFGFGPGEEGIGQG
jgi:hypothetical protein